MDNKIEYAIFHKENVFVHGAAGTGKTTEIMRIYNLLKNQGMNVYMTATTGTAAVGKGTTFHRFAGIGIGKGTKEQLYKKVMKIKQNVERWRNSDILFIDEISMFGSALFDKLDYVARRIRKIDKPFGGLQLVISGDLLQLPPINDEWIFESEAYEKCNFHVFNLTESKRYGNDEFFERLLRIRKGNQTAADINFLQECHKKCLQTKFCNLDIRPTILYSRKIDVNYHNTLQLQELYGNEKIYEAEDCISSGVPQKKVSKKQKEYFTTLLNNIIPRQVALKVGAQVMLRKNINIKSKLVNGSRGVVEDMDEKEVKVRFMNGLTAMITYEIWEVYDDNYSIIRMQIPLILAYSITCHKSQGATLDCVVCDLGSSIFSPAQAYIALSRVRNPDGLYISDFDPKSIKVDQKALKYITNFE